MAESIMIFVYIFVLAVFVGFELISRVPPLLHTPLMSGSNAISGITIVGALLIAGIASQGENALLSKILGMIALIFAIGIFILTGNVHWGYGIILAGGMAIGGWFGAKLAVKGGEKIIRIVLIMAILIMAAKLLKIF